MSISTKTQQKQVEDYRYGQRITYNTLNYAWRRQPYANKIVVGAVDDAVGKGINIVDSKTRKKIKKNDQAREIIDTMWLDIKKNMYYERAYGKSLGMFYAPDGLAMPVWRAYDVNQYTATYDKFATPTMFGVTNRVGGQIATVNSERS